MLFPNNKASALLNSLNYPTLCPSKWQNFKTKFKRKSSNFKRKICQILPQSNYQPFEFENEMIIRSPNVNMLDSARSLTSTRVVYTPTIYSPDFGNDQILYQLYIKLRIEFYKTRKYVVETCEDVQDSIKKSLIISQIEQYDREPILMNDIINSGETIDNIDHVKIDELIAKQPADALFPIRRPPQRVTLLPLTQSWLEYNDAENIKLSNVKYGSEDAMRLELHLSYVRRVINELKFKQMNDLVVKWHNH